MPFTDCSPIFLGILRIGKQSLQKYLLINLSTVCFVCALDCIVLWMEGFRFLLGKSKSVERCRSVGRRILIFTRLHMDHLDSGCFHHLFHAS